MITRSIGYSISRAHLQCGMILIVLTCFALSPIIRADECAKCPPPGPSRRGLPPPSQGCAALGIGALQNFGGNTLYETAIGFGAMQHNNGSNNTAVGASALQNRCRSNTAVGVETLYYNTGQANTATGWRSLYHNTTGSFNVANGVQALTNNTTGRENAATGLGALSGNTTGNENVAVGFDALLDNNGNNNTALGASAGKNLTTGNYNLNIGNPGLSGNSGTIRIGGEQHTRTFVAGINGIGVTGAGVYVDGAGQLGTTPSSERFKEEIKPMDKASESIFALKPVSFRYKEAIDPEGRQQFGLVAEEVEKINPALVARDAKGKAYTVRYEAVNAMLLNEFLKEHRTVHELKNEVSVRTATVREQSRQIQQLSTQVELTKSAPLLAVDSCVSCRGVGNTSLGSHALENLGRTASNNTAVGVGALQSNSTGRDNTATGYYALNENEGGDYNTATGAEALRSNRANNNTATGWQALRNNTTGSLNVADGAQALANNITGHHNTAIGFQALFNNTTGALNVAVGSGALLGNTTGSNNIALGAGAGRNITTGDFNLDIDNPGVAGDSRTIRIGNEQHTRTFIAGINGAAVPGAPVFVNAAGQLGTVPSSERFKEEIKLMNKASETAFALKPVTFRYQNAIDPEGRQQFGLVAEEVEKVDPALVLSDAKDKAYTVRYETVNAMLLNEFLKEHRTVLELKKQLAALSATEKERSRQIRKLAAQFDASAPTLRVTLQVDEDCAKCREQDNTSLGTEALQEIHGSSTVKNTAIGVWALRTPFGRFDYLGEENTGTGFGAIYYSKNLASHNTATGVDALHDCRANNNTATGYHALRAVIRDEPKGTQGNQNVADGAEALPDQNAHHNDNTAIGYRALLTNRRGVGNVAVGSNALWFNNGSNNTALGAVAGRNLTGNFNLDIGNAGVSVESNTIRIGNEQHTRTFITGISGAGVTGAAVVVNAAGQLGIAPSSERFKEEIKPMDKASESIFALKPVTFRYKKAIDPEGRQQFGLVAEEVEKVNPALVVRDKEGRPYSVRYDQVNAMLLNEFLKEHRTVQALKKEVATLIAIVKEQFRQIQKIGAQLEVSKPAPLVVDNQQSPLASPGAWF